MDSLCCWIVLPFIIYLLFKINLNLLSAACPSESTVFIWLLCWSCLVLCLPSEFCDSCAPQSFHPQPPARVLVPLCVRVTWDSSQKAPRTCISCPLSLSFCKLVTCKKGQEPNSEPITCQGICLLWVLGQALVGKAELLSSPRGEIHRGENCLGSFFVVKNL